jgi:Ca2+-binding RTX toxin-like protein
MLAVALPAALAAVAIGGADAYAATASMDGGTLNHRGASGEFNGVTAVSEPGSTIRLTDTAGLRAGVGCLQVDGKTVRCGLVQRLDVRTGDQRDTYVARTGLPTVYDAGSGNDVFRWDGAAGSTTTRVDYRGSTGTDEALYQLATAGVQISKDGVANDGRFLAGATIDKDNVRPDVEKLVGTRFNDSLNGMNASTSVTETFVGGAGSDLLSGNSGPDVFDQGAAPDGGDTVLGGAGKDTVDYSQRTARISASIDQAQADGGDGENDDLKTVEVIKGGSGGDAMNVAPSSLVPVEFYGGAGGDILLGGAAKDLLDGGPNEDVLSSKGGDDRIRSADTDRDFVLCGDQTDTVELDLTENQVDQCENIVIVR